MSQARMKPQFQGAESKNELSDIDKKFLMAVRARNYPECNQWLAAGANIDAKFGECSQDRQDACSFCGPNDTSLTHAVKKEDETLIKFLLENKASTEVYNCDKTPLMIAAFHHNVNIVRLLLQFGANANAVDLRTSSSAMLYLFSGLMGSMLNNQMKPCEQVATLLMQGGFYGTNAVIYRELKNRGYERRIYEFFNSTWKKRYNKVIENLYTQGATAGALGNHLNSDMYRHIASFLDRADGADLARTCKAAEASANKERGEEVIIFRNLFTNTLAEGKKICDELNKLTGNLAVNLHWEYYPRTENRKTAEARLVSDNQQVVHDIVKMLNETFKLQLVPKRIARTVPAKFAVQLDEETVRMLINQKRNAVVNNQTAHLTASARPPQ